MTTTIFLVRHAAHTDLGLRLTGRKEGVSLSEAGRDQARSLGERLKREKLAAIWSSPRERAQETAAEIASASRLPLATDEALDEIDFGGWTGSSFEDLGGQPLWAEWNERRGSARPPGGEAMAEAVTRASAVIERAFAEHPGRAVALVSHADIIRGLVAHQLGLSLDNLLRFDVDPASVSTIVAGDWGRRLISLNEKVTA